MPRSRRHFYDVRQYAILLNDEGHFLAMQLPKRYQPYGGLWTLPGGKLEPRDTPDEGLLREIEEETALDAEVIKPIHVARWDTESSRKIAVFYLCKVKGEKDTPILSEEHHKAQWMALEDAEDITFYSPYFIDAIKKASE